MRRDIIHSYIHEIISRTDGPFMSPTFSLYFFLFDHFLILGMMWNSLYDTIQSATNPQGSLKKN